ncbi:PREDICTED: uncharacterized protein LOC104793394 isoform X2 [Camelina sativa]|uniref:Uncharacterized protein LOC104793394 isoform X2 n=1 Tax=Camelina sativa TaxID=90675 RepID=A0ABM1Q6K5_CAMSA|nr:PREDICTED: uncharacterized protein LOC104793394 isoform X2 [Camelina sativa]
MDQNQACLLIYSYMTKLRTSFKEEYKRLCSIAAQVAPLLVTSHSTSSTVASASVVTSAQPCELQDALTARDFIGILAGKIQQSEESVAPLETFFKCLDGFSSSEETLEKLSQYMDHRQATELYESTMMKMKKEVRADYQSLCQLKCDRERSVQQQPKLEDAFTLAEFLETLARDNQLKRNTTAYEEVLLKCFQHYSASEKMADELKQKNLDATEANLLYHQILRKMNIKGEGISQFVEEFAPLLKLDEKQLVR